MKTQRIVEILKSGVVDTDIVVKGWVRTKRGNKNVAFIALNDGSCVANIQVVVDLSKFCLLYTSPSPRDRQKSRMPSSA